MRVFITGIAGVLGSSLARSLLEAGYSVAGNDVARIDEAWRLADIRDQIRYVWKASNDLVCRDLKEYDVLFDCGLGVPDRPFGNGSPEYTVIGNILPSLRILEIARRLREKGYTLTAVYASSFNSLYGNVGVEYAEDTPIAPTSVYGWTKGAVEELYRTYIRAYSVPAIITRVGSAYGPAMRSDELVARLMINTLLDKHIALRSPRAKRLWCYSRDVLSFYLKLMDHIDILRGETLICAGNRGDTIVENVELMKLVFKVIGKETTYSLVEYEPGELVGGRPVSFSVNAEYSRQLLGWEPRYSLEDGLRETAEWFRENIWRYK